MAWHDPSKITPEIREGYRLPLKAENWDRALWEFTAASERRDLPARLTEIHMPVLVVTGDDDRIVPTRDSLRLADELPGADLAVIEDAGHLPHEEQPGEFMRVLSTWLEKRGLVPQPILRRGCGSPTW